MAAGASRRAVLMASPPLVREGQPGVKRRRARDRWPGRRRCRGRSADLPLPPCPSRRLVDELLTGSPRLGGLEEVPAGLAVAIGPRLELPAHAGPVGEWHPAPRLPEEDAGRGLR